MAGCTAPGGDGGGDEKVEISVLVPNAGPIEQVTTPMIAAFEKANPNIKVSVAFHPGGAEGDNLIKTKLATDDMEDAFFYIGGSLMMALNPDQTLTDLSDQPWAGDLAESFVTVASTDKGMYSTPMGTSQAGVVLYNKKVYADLGLEVPTDWKSFMANNQIIKDAGIAPIVQTYADPWTSQLFVLGDFANVTAQEPDWADRFTENKARTADQPAVQAWLNQQAAFEAGFFNADFSAANFDDGMRMLALGEAVHYPMLSGGLGTLAQNYPDAVNDIGGFAFPAQDSKYTTLTVWPPNSWFIPKSTEGAKLDAAKKFLAFVNSPEGCALQNEHLVPSGPYVISSCTLPSDVAPLLNDLQAYFDAGKSSAALEFRSPVKGPNLELITVEVGSGIRTGQEGAALYDEDVKKQAQQLGLEGW